MDFRCYVKRLITAKKKWDDSQPDFFSDRELHICSYNMLSMKQFCLRKAITC